MNLPFHYKGWHVQAEAGNKYYGLSFTRNW